MTEFQEFRLEKAVRVLAGARRDLGAGDAPLATDRAYYAMFYAAEALLFDRGLSFSTHGAVHGAFGKEFAKTGVLDPKFHRWLLDAFRTRQKTVYDVDVEISQEDAERLIAQADEFLATARTYLETSH